MLTVSNGYSKGFITNTLSSFIQLYLGGGTGRFIGRDIYRLLRGMVVLFNSNRLTIESFLSRFEMNGSGSSEIFILPSDRHSLEENLRLSWKWLKYTGLHPNLLLITVDQHRWSSTVRFLFTIFILLLILGYGVYQVVQLVIRSWKVEKMVETVPNVTCTIFLLYVIASQCLVWMKRKKIVELFKDWKQIELQSKCSHVTETKTMINLLFNGVLFSIICNIPMFFAWNVMEPERTFFLSHYSVVREMFGLYAVCTVNTFIITFFSILLLCSFFLPVIFFYNVTLIVRNLTEEWEARLRNEEYLRVIWRKYEKIVDLVDQGNECFGAILIIQHFVFVSVICLAFFFSLGHFQDPILMFFMLFGSATFTIVSCTYNWMLSQLYFSKSKLQKSVIDALTRDWYKQGETDRHLHGSFLARLDKGDLAVCPLNLFTVCPSNLLSILGVVMNYLVVLAQSR